MLHEFNYGAGATSFYRLLVPTPIRKTSQWLFLREKYSRSAPLGIAVLCVRAGGGGVQCGYGGTKQLQIVGTKHDIEKAQPHSGWLTR